MARYRKLPVVIEAVQWNGCPHEYPGGGCSRSPFVYSDGVEHLVTEHGIPTLEGFMRLTPGDWIITGIKGEKYPCKPGIFAATYEEAN